MGMNSIFRNQGGDYIASYSYDEIISATGYITLYLSHDSAIAPFRFYTETVYLAGSYSCTVGSTTDQSHDMDFDLAINKPLNIRGKAYINIPCYISASTGGVDMHAEVTIKSWDGASETIIATGSSLQSNYASGQRQMTVIVDVPLTTIKAGETLRVTITVDQDRNANGDNSGTLYVA